MHAEASQGGEETSAEVASSDICAKEDQRRRGLLRMKTILGLRAGLALILFGVLRCFRAGSAMGEGAKQVKCVQFFIVLRGTVSDNRRAVLKVHLLLPLH